MVRFEQRLIRANQQLQKFQFLYGSIQAVFSVPDLLSIIEFQFLYGAIQTQDHSRSRCCPDVSIPLWCDSNWNVVFPFAIFTKFQFLYGVIQTRFMALGLIGLFSFNS